MAAINFPDSPSNGDTHVVGGVTYTYDSTETKWKTTINSNAFLPLSGGTVSGTLTVNDDLAVDTDTLFVDASTNRVGIGTASAATPLHVYRGDTEGDTLRLAGSTDGNFRSLTFSTEAAGGFSGALHRQTIDSNSGTFAFSNNSGELLRITSTGDLKFNSGYGSVATAYGCRAWINFDGSAATIGTGRASGNMDAVTDNATGDYTLNFTNAMPDANYAAIGSACSAAGGQVGIAFMPDYPSATQTTTSLRIESVLTNTNNFDAVNFYVAIFR
jgi:hypothetical protein